jgi:hypothetical protein
MECAYIYGYIAFAVGVPSLVFLIWYSWRVLQKIHQSPVRWVVVCRNGGARFDRWIVIVLLPLVCIPSLSAPFPPLDGCPIHISALICDIHCLRSATMSLEVWGWDIIKRKRGLSLFCSICHTMFPTHPSDWHTCHWKCFYHYSAFSPPNLRESWL